MGRAKDENSGLYYEKWQGPNKQIKIIIFMTELDTMPICECKTEKEAYFFLHGYAFGRKIFDGLEM